MKRSLQVIVISVILIFFSLQVYKGWSQLDYSNLRLDFGLLAISVVLVVFYFSLGSLPWYFIMRYNNAKIPYGELTRVWFISQLSRYIPGKVWIVVGRLYLCSKYNVPKHKVLISTFLEFALLLISALFVSSLFVLSGFKVFPAGQLLLFLLIFLALAILIKPSIFTRFINFGLKILGKEPITVGISYFQLVKVTVIFIGMWLIEGVSFYFFVQAIYPIKIELLIPFTGLFAVAWTAGFLSFLTPGGIGVREGVMVLLLSYFIPAPIAVVISIANRILLTIIEGIMSLTVMLILRPRK